MGIPLLNTWPGDVNGIEDVVIWGINPIKALNEIRGALDDAAGAGKNPVDLEEYNPSDIVNFFYLDLDRRTDEIKEVLYRFNMYLRLLEKKLKTLCPDDPLVKNPKKVVMDVVNCS